MSETFNVTILGSSAATPTSLRHTTAQLLQYHNKRFLLDCAEGTQMLLRRLKVPLMKINHIFISHLHGDHYLGLPGLLFTFHLLGRKKDLHVYAPPGLEAVIRLQYQVSELTPSFEVVFHDIQHGGEMLYDDNELTVSSIAMKHRIPTYGFLFKEKEKERNIIKSSIRKYKIPIEVMPDIKQGADYITRTGERILNNDLTTAPPLPRSYAFCSDTAYTEEFIEQIRGVDLLYHEATFLNDKAAIAREKMHSTALEAGTLAHKAGVKKLILGHYSARYKDVKAFKTEARTVFPKAFLAEEGEVFSI